MGLYSITTAMMIDFSALLKTLLIDRDERVEMNWNNGNQNSIRALEYGGKSAFYCVLVPNRT